MSDHNIESHIKVYWNVFYALLAFTLLTVSVSFYDFQSVFLTFFIGLSIACVKGYLVAGFFMHLNDERKSIYYLLGLTAIFLFVLLFMPTIWRASAEDISSDYEPYVKQDQYGKDWLESDEYNKAYITIHGKEDH